LGPASVSAEGSFINGGCRNNARYGAAFATITTTIVHCEYPDGTRFDIALFDDSRLRHCDPALGREEGWKNDPFWNQPVRAAVEPKYGQLGEKEPAFEKKVEKDVEKLKRCGTGKLFLGVFLLFLQSAERKSARGDSAREL